MKPNSCGCMYNNSNNNNMNNRNQCREKSIPMSKKWIAIIFYETCLACAFREYTGKGKKITWKR